MTKKTIIVLAVGLILAAGVFWGRQAEKSDEPVDVDKKQDTETLEVKLFYYNKNLDLNNDCRPEAVVAVAREIPKTPTPIQDTIDLLLEGRLSEEEVNKGFSSEFPQKGFELLGANLKEGVLTLEFSQVPGFTSGGACRIGLLRAQIEKTALQFEEVEKVEIMPEEVLQP